MSDAAQIERALEGHKRSLARLISICETERPEASFRREAILDVLRKRPNRATIIGITGTPGAGKSSLVARIGERLLKETNLRVAMVAVDPASPISGGALLGDRTRVRLPSSSRFFFRSQSASTSLGGLGVRTFDVCRLLECLFDLVIVETVGIGQSETEVRDLASRVYLVVQPLAGDQVQFMKAGVMEIPDVIVVNKCDAEREARRSVAQLRSSLRLLRAGGEPPGLIATSAQTGRGVDTLVEDIKGAVRSGGCEAAETAFFERWVLSEFGKLGLAYLRATPTTLSEAASFDQAKREFGAKLINSL
jgi:LAO/AO transport system kinase